MNPAIRNNHFEVVKWLHEEGCPVSKFRWYLEETDPIYVFLKEKGYDVKINKKIF
jgi:hypothetical protein